MKNITIKKTLMNIAITAGITSAILVMSVSVGIGFASAAATVTTYNITGLSSSSVILNGYVDPQGVANTSAGFEWGTNSSVPLGSTTTLQSYGGPMGFSYTLANLSPNTTYYYRAVASQNGVNYYGQIYVLSQSNIGWGTYFYPFTTGGLAPGWGNMVYGSGNTNYNNTYPYGCTGNYCGNYYNSNTYGNQPVVNTYSPNVSGNFAVLNGYIDPNGNGSIVRWFEWGTNQYSLSNTTNKANQSYAGTWSDNVINLVANTTYYYRAVAQANSGNTYGQVMSFTTGAAGSQGSYNYNYGTGTQTYSGAAQTVAVTNLASSVTLTGARMNGQVVLQNTGTPSNGWFEWGATSALGNTTQTKNVGGNTTNIFNEILSNLSPNATYYYRAVGQNQYGIFKGDIVSFVTANPVAAPIAANYASTAVAKTSIAKPSLINLTITSDNEGICRGDYATLTVNYANASNETLKDVILRVSLPKELTYQDVSKGTFSKKDNMVTVAIDALNSNESGIVVVKVVVAETPTSDGTIVTTADVVYTRASGTQEETIAYTLQKPNCVAGTNAALALFGAGGFFPNTLLGWLVLTTIIFILAVLSRNLYGSYKDKEKLKAQK